MKRINSSVRIAATGLVLFVSHSASAAFDSPYMSNSSSAPGLEKAIDDDDQAQESKLFEPQVSDTLVSLVEDDFLGKISPEFRIPRGLKNEVGFWLKIYTQYTSDYVAIYDRRHPEVIYEVMDFRELRQNSRNDIAYEIVRKNKISERFRQYRIAFKRLRTKANKRARLNSEAKKLQGVVQKNIVLATAKSSHQHSYQDFSKNIRGQTGQRNFLITGIQAAAPFTKKMEELFEANGVPKELTRLSLLESSFNLNAVSKVGASGVWQFMPLSAKEYMHVGTNVDERLSPLKSTVAAAKLLRRNKKVLGNWGLALTAYNSGLVNLIKVPKKQRGNYGHIFSGCKNKYRLGVAGSSYYAGFLGVLYAERYKKLFFGDLAPSEDSHYQSTKLVYVPVKKSQSALDFAFETGVSVLELQHHNPDIRDLNKRLPKGFKIAVSKDDSFSISLLKDPVAFWHQEMMELLAQRGHGLSTL